MISPIVLLTSLSALFTSNYAITYYDTYNPPVNVTNYTLNDSFDTIRTYELVFNPTTSDSNYDILLLKSFTTSQFNTEITIVDEFDYGDDTYDYSISISCEGYIPSTLQGYTHANFHILVNYSNSFGVYHSFLILDPYDDTYSYSISDNLSVYDTSLFKPDGNINRYHYLSITYYIDNYNFNYYWNNGYNQGVNDSASGWRLDNYLFAIVDIPFYTMRQFFNDSLFGGPGLFAILMSLVTIAIIIGIIKRFLK